VKAFRMLLLAIITLLAVVSMSLGTADHAKKEKKACTYCHTPGNFKELTDAGKYYKKNNYSLKGYKEPQKK